MVHLRGAQRTGVRGAMADEMVSPVTDARLRAWAACNKYWPLLSLAWGKPAHIKFALLPSLSLFTFLTCIFYEFLTSILHSYPTHSFNMQFTIVTLLALAATVIAVPRGKYYTPLYYKSQWCTNTLE